MMASRLRRFHTWARADSPALPRAEGAAGRQGIGELSPFGRRPAAS
jgi:hypothetical protein